MKMNSSDAAKIISRNKGSVGLLAVGIIAAASYAQRKAAGKGKAEAREPDMSRFPADE